MVGQTQHNGSSLYMLLARLFMWLPSSGHLVAQLWLDVQETSFLDLLVNTGYQLGSLFGLNVAFLSPVVSTCFLRKWQLGSNRMKAEASMPL